MPADLALGSVLLRELYVHDSLGKERITKVGKTDDGHLFLDRSGQPQESPVPVETTSVAEPSAG